MEIFGGDESLLGYSCRLNCSLRVSEAAKQRISISNTDHQILTRLVTRLNELNHLPWYHRYYQLLQMFAYQGENEDQEQRMQLERDSLLVYMKSQTMKMYLLKTESALVLNRRLERILTKLHRSTYTSPFFNRKSIKLPLLDWGPALFLLLNSSFWSS